MEMDLETILTHPSLSHTPRGRHDLPRYVRWTLKPLSPPLLSIHPLPALLLSLCLRLRNTDLLLYPPVCHFPLRRKFQ